MLRQAASLHSDKIAVCFDECNNQPPVYYTYKTVINAASELSNFLLLKSESVRINPGLLHYGRILYHLSHQH
ncbi:hypothetical protein FD755_008150 [Muntiacus reevesi]|uniref:Uncharacterized protein n=1 Tax=Muntiacus reevesi TaxID=9886 RepID=A0A5J5MIV0_MUNRE|nr:hypothetical protein FD755_008150 [Muntiacus reevesi]